MCIYRGTGVLILKALAHICSGSVLSIGCRGVGGGGERERTMEFNDVTFDRCSSFLFFLFTCNYCKSLHTYEYDRGEEPRLINYYVFM